MRLGLSVGYGGSFADNLGLVREAEELGYSIAWVSEGYGSDAVSIMSALAAATERIDIGSGIMQIPGRAPTMTAMTAATLDDLSHGRFRLGLGLSGPQVSEGWYGVRWDAPLRRTREYVDVVRLALSRGKVQYDGSVYQLPLPNGPGKALRLMSHPVREHIPLYLASVGPRNVELAGEICDGWLAVFFSPDFASDLLAHVSTGRQRAGKELAGFDIVANVPIVAGDDHELCATPVRDYAALYIGGMGTRQQNFYNALASRMGFAEEAAKIQDLYLGKRYDEAKAAVPFEFLDRTSLLGPRGRIAEGMAHYAEAGVTTLTVSPFAASHDERIRALRTAREALADCGFAE